ncbi:NUDIX domain-containing protein [Candidatus Saccharibacteria bacterium]|nr:NUDIX domain-containing protein [Candidatus Saccharibacteria bacterium]
MRVYFSGLGGVGIGPLAEIARDAGYDVVGSDMARSSMTKQLQTRGIEVMIGQDGSQIATAHDAAPIDWFVYTSALPPDHAELVFASEHGIRTSKRDEFLAEFIRDHDLKLIAVAGTHGKTTTTGLFLYACHALGIPLSYSIGTTISWGPSGHFDSASEYFVYECDEYDRNFLHFEPTLSIITALDYDHVDTFATVDEYKNAFRQFIQQSSMSVMWENDRRYVGDFEATHEAYDELMDLSHISLPGAHVRRNAFLVQQALEKLFVDDGRWTMDDGKAPDGDTVTIQTSNVNPLTSIVQAINTFPGTSRRFEKLTDNFYSDYGHHPAEIAATLQMARELSDHVVLVYQPHQNVRQHQIRDDYTDDIFRDASDVYWLPTYLSREDPRLETLTPKQLSAHISHDKVHIADTNDQLWDNICRHRDAGHLVLVMGAGSIDTWVHTQLSIRCSGEVLVVDSEGNFVMQHRDDKPGITNPGRVTSFGGSAEIDENTRDAAYRELCEETNLSLSKDDLRYLVTLFQDKVADGTSRWATYFVVKVQDTSNLEVYEGQGYKIILPHDRDNYPLSDLARKATDYLLAHADTY